VDSVVDMDPRCRYAVRKDVQVLQDKVVSVGAMGQKMLLQCALKMEYVYLKTETFANKKDARIMLFEEGSAVDMGQ